MSAAKVFWFTLVFSLLVVLNYTLRPVLEWRASIDFLMIALLLVSVRARPGVAAFAGFALGLLADALTPGAFGASALAMTVVGFGASWLKAAFFADNVALNLIFVFVGKWAFDLLFLVAERRLVGTDLLLQAVLWSPLSAAVTAVAGVIVLLAVRPLFGAPRA